MSTGTIQSRRPSVIRRSSFDCQILLLLQILLCVAVSRDDGIIDSSEIQQAPFILSEQNKRT
jgi:hypothetical protein